jgi:hypothetical protein
MKIRYNMFKLNLYNNLEKRNNIINNKQKENFVSKIYNENMNFYVCGSGGCGSTLLFRYLSNFGKAYHIHDRYPPNKLCYVGKENTNEDIYHEWFNSTEIANDKLSNYKVIFIYRNPIDVIFSRFIQPSGPNVPHLQHVKCINDGNIGLGDIIRLKKDLYGLEEFYDNYTIPKNRNYKIYCIKYEELFTNIKLLNRILEIPDIPQLYPKKQERRKQHIFIKELLQIYSSLINKMRNMRFVEIIYPIQSQMITDKNNT